LRIVCVLLLKDLVGLSNGGQWGSVDRQV